MDTQGMFYFARRQTKGAALFYNLAHFAWLLLRSSKVNGGIISEQNQLTSLISQWYLLSQDRYQTPQLDHTSTTNYIFKISNITTRNFFHITFLASNHAKPHQIKSIFTVKKDRKQMTESKKKEKRQPVSRHYLYNCMFKP